MIVMSWALVSSLPKRNARPEASIASTFKGDIQDEEWDGFTNKNQGFTVF